MIAMTSVAIIAKVVRIHLFCFPLCGGFVFFNQSPKIVVLLYCASVENHTVRGCLVHLMAGEKEQCLSNNDTCMACFSNGCNSNSSLRTPSYEMFADILKNGKPVLCNDDTAEAPTVAPSEDVPSNDNVHEHIDYTPQNTPEMLTCYQCDDTDNGDDSIQQLDDNHTVLCPPDTSDNGCYHMIKGESEKIPSLRRKI